MEQPSIGSKGRLNIIGESFAEDFRGVINLIKTIKLPLTKEKGIPSKSAVVKMNSVLTNKDFLFGHIGEIDKIRSIKDTNRIYGIFMILAELNLICENDNTMCASSEVEAFINLKLEDKCRYLLEHYLKSRRIYEVSRIVESGYKAEHMGNMTECRNVVIKHFKNCPVGMWVSTRQFIDYIKIIEKNFLMDQVKYITYFSEKHRVYLDQWVEWEEVKGRFIEVVLQEYLSVLGIVDTVIYESKGGCSDYYEMPFFRVEYFRITSLGAFILGMSKDYHYEEQESKSGFTVEDGFQVKVINEPSNQVHMLFFECFACREEYLHYCIYKISFTVKELHFTMITQI